MSDFADPTMDNDDLGFDFDCSSYKKEEDFTAGSGPIPDGKYHVVVESVEKDHSGNNPALKFTFGILAGTTPGQVGRKVHERLFLTEKAKARVMIFANRLGLIGKADVGQPNVRKNWGDARNKQVIIEVATREYDKKDGSKGKASNVTFGGIWRLDDAEVKDVPRSGAAARAAQAPAAAAPAPSKAADAFDDL
jgi:hypothetical protein